MNLKHCSVVSGRNLPVIRCRTYIKTLFVLLLLLVDYAQAKVYFIRLLKVRLHLHDLRKRFLGVLQGSIPIVEDTNAIP